MADKEFAKGLYINPTALTKDLTTSKTQFVFLLSVLKKWLDWLLAKQTYKQARIY